jgi:hypothetical protein
MTLHATGVRLCFAGALITSALGLTTPAQANLTYAFGALSGMPFPATNIPVKIMPTATGFVTLSMAQLPANKSAWNLRQQNKYGEVVWDRDILFNAGSYASALTQDKAGNILFGGEFLDAAGIYQGAIYKYSPAGVRQWGRTILSQFKFGVQIYDLGTDAANNVYVASLFKNSATSSCFLENKFAPTGAPMFSRHDSSVLPDKAFFDDEGDCFTSGGGNLGGRAIMFLPSGVEGWAIDVPTGYNGQTNTFNLGSARIFEGGMSMGDCFVAENWDLRPPGGPDTYSGRFLHVYKSGMVDYTGQKISGNILQCTPCDAMNTFCVATNYDQFFNQSEALFVFKGPTPGWATPLAAGYGSKILGNPAGCIIAQKVPATGAFNFRLVAPDGHSLFTVVPTAVHPFYGSLHMTGLAHMVNTPNGGTLLFGETTVPAQPNLFAAEIVPGIALQSIEINTAGASGGFITLTLNQQPGLFSSFEVDLDTYSALSGMDIGSGPGKPRKLVFGHYESVKKIEYITHPVAKVESDDVRARDVQGVTRDAKVEVKPASLLLVTLDHSSVKGGGVAGGTISFKSSAAVGTVVHVVSSNQGVIANQDLTVEAAGSSMHFDLIDHNTKSVPQSVKLTFYTIGGDGTALTLTETVTPE